MAKITIDKDKCKGCFLCISFCPKGLIKKSSQLNKLGVTSVEFSRRVIHKDEAGSPAKGGGKSDKECLGCALCAIICPDCCIEVYK